MNPVYGSNTSRLPSVYEIDDICKYVSKHGFDVLRYLVVNGVIDYPEEYSGWIVRDVKTYRDRVEIITDRGRIVMDEDKMFIGVVKKGVKTGLMTHKLRGVDGEYIMLTFKSDPEINYDEVWRLISEKCRINEW